jgi:phage tail-like protein
MPGFIINGTGGDTGSPGADAKAEFRRKHRWRVSTGPGLDAGDWTYLQKAQRPHYKLEEPVVHHNEEQAYFAGKRSWEPIALVFYDKVGANGGSASGAAGGGSSDLSTKLWQWIAETGGNDNVTDVKTATTSLPSDYKKQLILQMLDGQGEPDETWQIFNAWPKEVNWNDLDYTNTEIQLINVTLRYDRAVRGDL